MLQKSLSVHLRRAKAGSPQFNRTINRTLGAVE
jgi:hypothetical protein